MYENSSIAFRNIERYNEYKFLKFQLILRGCFIMKEQLNQLSAYQPGLSQGH